MSPKDPSRIPDCSSMYVTVTALNIDWRWRHSSVADRPLADTSHRDESANIGIDLASGSFVLNSQ